MEVDLIGIEDRLTTRSAVDDGGDLSETSVALFRRPRAQHDGLRPAEPCTDGCEDAPHGADGHARETAPLHLEA